MRKKEVMIVTGAGQISMAIARRVGYGKKIVMGDKNIKNAKAIAEGGCGVTISSQSGWRMPQLTAVRSVGQARRKIKRHRTGHHRDTACRG